MLQFVDSADRYVTGNCADTAMSGIWLSVPTGVNAAKYQVVEPSFGAYSGDKCWYVEADALNDDIRFALDGGAFGEIFFVVPWYLPNLPSGSGRRRIEFRDNSNALVCYVSIEPTGTMALYNSAGTKLAETASPVMVAASWTFFEMRLVCGTGTGIWQVRDAAGNVLANFSGLTFAGTIGIIAFKVFYNVGEQTGAYYFGEPIVKDTGGGAQDTWYAAGGVKVYRLPPVADDPDSAWSFTGRRMYGPGVGQIIDPAANSGWRLADTASFELGSGDFTIEGTFRWNSLPGSGETQYLAAKWFPSSAMSWAFKLYENSGSYYLSFVISTDGTATGEVIIHDFPFEPNLYQPYVLSVSKNSSVSRMYVDGVKQGADVADAYTYANTTALLTVGARQSAVSTLADPFDGWIDELRYTVGVGRYPAEYTPDTEAFPRDSSDPYWNSVQLLMGWDVASVDNSQYGRTVTVNGDAAQLTTDDGLYGYQSIDKPGRDDTFVEAALLPAEGTIEFVSVPLAGETVVIGTDTYTYRAAVSVAYDVKIGADIDESMANLIAAVNAGAGAGTLYGTGTVANADVAASALPGAISLMEAVTPGVAGNSLAFTTTVTDAVISGSGTLSGGADIPDPGIYRLDRLPRGVTRVEAIAMFTRRSVYGPGSAQITPSFIDSSLAASSGANTSAPANPGWQMDIFSENGGNPWSAADFIDAKLQLNRTA